MALVRFTLMILRQLAGSSTNAKEPDMGLVCQALSLCKGDSSAKRQTRCAGLGHDAAELACETSGRTRCAY